MITRRQTTRPHAIQPSGRLAIVPAQQLDLMHRLPTQQPPQNRQLDNQRAYCAEKDN